MQPLHLALIGGGPSSACVVNALARHPELCGRIHLTVFEPNPRLWHGQVFQPDMEVVLANVPMKTMSLDPGDPEHGVRWLRDQAPLSFAAEALFPPRALVGRYLQDATAGAIAALQAAGSSVRIEEYAVHDLALRGRRIQLRADEGVCGDFDHVVLCPGAPPSYDPYRLAGQPGYVRDPYPLNVGLAEVPADASVAIIGSGLTAVDAVMGLRARDHQGPIFMVSRGGVLPSVRRTSLRPDFRHLTVGRLEDLATRPGGLCLVDVISLIEAELQAAGEVFEDLVADMASVMMPFQRLRDELHRDLVWDEGWALLRSGLVSCGQDAWYLLREVDKLVVREHHPELMRRCCPMPPENARCLLELFDAGQLDLVSGVESIQPRREGKPGFEIKASRNIVADVVIGASTPAKRESSPKARPLVDSLIAQGLAVPHAFGGLCIERTTSRLINRRGIADGRLHALGDLTNGAYLFTFGMPVLTARADGIVRDIAAALHQNQQTKSTSC